MRLIQAFPEVGDVEVSDDQVRGVNIAFKQFVNALGVERDPPAPPMSAGAFFAQRAIAPVMSRYGTEFVASVLDTRAIEAFHDPVKRAAMAQAGGFSLDVPVPADAVKP